MLNNTDKLAIQLNKLLLDSEETIAYKHAYKAIKAHPEILEMEEKLKCMQQALLKAKTDPSLETTSLLNEYMTLRDQFENHPLVTNYLHDKEALMSLCYYIQDAWQGQLD